MHDDVDILDEYMAKIRKMVAERDELRDERDAAISERDALKAEVTNLRGIVGAAPDPRTTAPVAPQGLIEPIIKAAERILRTWDGDAGVNLRDALSNYHEMRKSFGPPKGWEPFTSNPTKCVERDLTKGGSDHGTD